MSTFNSTTTAPDLFVLGGEQQSDNSETLSLFRDWLDTCRQLDEVDDDACDDDPGSDWNRLCDQQGNIEDRIFKCRGGAISLAAKVYLHLYREFSNWTPLTAQIRLEGNETGIDQAWVTSLLRDAAAAVPEIGECAAAIIHDDAGLISADMEIEWTTKHGVGSAPHPSERPEWRQELCHRLQAMRELIATTAAKTARGEAIKARHFVDRAQKIELRRRAEAIAAEFDPTTLPGGDAGLIEAERRLREIRRHDESLYHDFGKISVEVENEIMIGILDPVRDRLRGIVEETRPVGLAGAAAKLRMLTDPEIGIIIGEPSEGDITCLQQVAGFIEREAANGAASAT